MLKQKKSTSKRNGFTITEILVVVVLIAIVGTVIIVSLTKTNENKDSKQYQKEVEKLASASSVYVDTEEQIKDLLYSENGKVTLTVKELSDAGLIKREDFSNFDDETKITLYLDENEDVQALVDSEYTNYIKLTPTKDTLIINIDSGQAVSLVKNSEVMFCLPQNSDGTENCHTYQNKPAASTVKIDVIGTSGEITNIKNAENYVFTSAGTYAIRYVFTANDKEVTRYKYLVIYDNKCAISLPKVSVNGPGQQFSKTTGVEYSIVSGSGKYFVVTTSTTALTGQEIKQSATSGTISVPETTSTEPANISLYCYDDAGTLIGQNVTEVFVDTTSPTCANITVNGTAGNTVGGITFYRSNVSLSAEFGNGKQYNDNYGSTYTRYIIDDKKDYTPTYREIEGKSTAERNKVISSAKSSKNNRYYLHVVDAANNSCSVETTFHVDAIKPTLTVDGPNPAKIKHLTNMTVDKFYKNTSDTTNDPDGSGVAGVVVKSSHDSYNSTLTNINQLPVGTTSLKFTITDIAGNSQDYPYPEIGNLTIEPLYLWYALRDRKICTGASAADCPVFNEQAANNYVVFAGRTYRAYNVNSSNITRLVDVTAYPFSTTYMGCSYQYWVQTCSNGAGHWETGYKRTLHEIDLYRYLNKYFNELKSKVSNAATYLAIYPFDNSAAGNNSAIYNGRVGGLTAKDYQTIGRCSGSSCQTNYLNMTHNHWTISPVSSSSIYYKYIVSASSTLVGTTTEYPAGIYFHPVIAMNTTVKVISGTGTSANPFQLGL